MGNDPYNRKEYRDTVDYGVTDAKWTFWKIFGPLLGIVILVSIIGNGLGWFGEAATVAREEFGPRATLTKYEWFKDTAAQLDAKRANIKLLANRQKGMDTTYEGTPRKDWPRTDLEQYNLWESEVAGVKASYNTLAADYNAQMAKFNWSFAERGKLPEGATEPLPREFKPYEEN